MRAGGSKKVDAGAGAPAFMPCDLLRHLPPALENTEA